MTMKTMTASVASKEFGRYLDTAQREPVIVTKQNRPVAVTVSFQDWEELTNFRIERGLSQGIEDLEHGRFKEISDASTAARLARFKERCDNAA
jgi:prevent-host-death family protein